MTFSLQAFVASFKEDGIDGVMSSLGCWRIGGKAACSALDDGNSGELCLSFTQHLSLCRFD